MTTQQEPNKREFFRQQFPIPLCADVTISEINGKSVTAKHSLVCIKDIGAGGLRFESNLKFPIREDVIFTFNSTIYNKPIEMQGILTRCQELENDNYEYGVRFCLLDGDRQQDLVTLINKVAITFRRGTGDSGCSTCSLKTECYKSMLQKKQEYHLSD